MQCFRPTGLQSDDSERLAADIAEQIVEDMVCLLLTAHREIQGEKNKSQMERVIKREAELKELGKSQAVKNKKIVMGNIQRARQKLCVICQNNRRITLTAFGNC